MSSEKVTLRFWRGAPTVSVRELTGRDEWLVRETSTRAAVELLGRLIEAPGECSADELTAPDRDRLLAAVYRRTFGERIDSTAVCTRCASPYDLAFSIDDLMVSVERAEPAQSVEALADGTFRTVGGLHFRLPTAREEMNAAASPAEDAAWKLAQWCVVDAPEAIGAGAAVEEAIEDLAPILDLDITTACPECGVPQAVHFDMQFYLLRAIQHERAPMTRQIHRIASAYGWSLAEILDLRRSERRALVDLIEAELPARRIS